MKEALDVVIGRISIASRPRSAASTRPARRGNNVAPAVDPLLRRFVRTQPSRRGIVYQLADIILPTLRTEWYRLGKVKFFLKRLMGYSCFLIAVLVLCRIWRSRGDGQ